MSALDDVIDTARAHGWNTEELPSASMYSFTKADHEISAYFASNGRVISFSHTFQGRQQATDDVEQRDQIQTLMRVL